jgi:hypothetical protein
MPKFLVKAAYSGWYWQDALVEAASEDEAREKFWEATERGDDIWVSSEYNHDGDGYEIMEIEPYNEEVK